jgi:hypothetical protein
VVERLFALPADFPHLRASSDAFDRWADALGDVRPTPAVVREGVARLGRRERRRLVRAYSEALPGAESAMPILLVAAVAAALEERGRPDPLGLDLLEEDAGLRADPAETLTYALDATDVWSFPETLAADTALAALDEDLDEDQYELLWNEVLAREMKRLGTREHHRRLARLVKRLAALEPCPCHPLAWEAITSACAAFERDRELAGRLLESLLTDSLGRVWQQRVLRAA